jgi:hypothetical protein
MTGNLISSGSDTDLRMGLVVALSLAVVVSVVAIVGPRQLQDRGMVTLSASAPEMVSQSPKLVAHHPAGAGAAIE